MKLVNFYEVHDHKGDAVWGGASAIEATTWFRKGLDSKVYVSIWDEEDIEEPRLVTDKIDVTPLMLAALMSGRFGYTS